MNDPKSADDDVAFPFRAQRTATESTTTESHESTPNCKLFAAICSKDLASFKQLLSQENLDFSSKNAADGDTPLISCIRYHFADGFHALIKCDLDIHINTRNQQGITPFLAATEDDSPRGWTMLQALFEANADINLPYLPGPAEQQGFREVSAINYAVYKKNIPAVSLLLKSGADVNFGNDTGIYPLKIAIQRNDPAMVDFLIASKAQAHPMPFDKNIAPPLQIAISMGVYRDISPDIVRSLMKAGAKLEAPFILIAHQKQYLYDALLYQDIDTPSSDGSIPRQVVFHSFPHLPHEFKEPEKREYRKAMEFAKNGHYGLARIFIEATSDPELKAAAISYATQMAANKAHSHGLDLMREIGADFHQAPPEENKLDIEKTPLTSAPKGIIIEKLIVDKIDNNADSEQDSYSVPPPTADSETADTSRQADLIEGGGMTSDVAHEVHTGLTGFMQDPA